MATGGDGPKGIDVSKWQTTTPSLVGLSFLFARASIGTQRDEMYATHIRNARRAGLLVGAYHFNHGPLSIAEQVRVFLDAAGDVDFYALDVEGRDAFSRAQTADFIKRVQATGRKCGLYMSESQFYDAGQDWHWVANWSREPSRPYHFWQWQGSPLDRNTFNGTPAELRALASGSTEDDLNFIPATGLGTKLLRVPAGTDIFDLDGVKVTDMTNGADLTYVGPYAGGFAVIVTTSRLYPDGVRRPTLLLAKTGTLIDAPATSDPTLFSQADIDAAVAAQKTADAALLLEATIRARDEGIAEADQRVARILGLSVNLP